MSRCVGRCPIRFPGSGLPHPVRDAGAAPDHVDEDHTRCGDDAIAGLNEALLAKAAAAKLLRTDKVRADTTVVSAGWPTRPIRDCWPR
jgi:ABC-type thiamine transport system substrate-binding protein